MAYLEVAPNQDTSWAQRTTIFRGLGHVPENLNFKECFWCSCLEMDEECYLCSDNIDIVQFLYMFCCCSLIVCSVTVRVTVIK